MIADTTATKAKIAIATGTRADWGLLRPLARELSDRGAEIEILATHAHLIPEMGNTIEEIIADGFTPAAAIPAFGTPAEATAMALRGFGEYFSRHKPDRIVILGDRFEMLGTASAALFAGIPIAHIAGGTVSEGAFDDQIRNAISQMAALHFPETDECADRLISMGIPATRIHTAGALGLAHLDTPVNTDVTLSSQAADILDFTRGAPTLIMTLHAETAPADPAYTLEEATRQLLQAVEPLLGGYRLVITYPNADVDPTAAVEIIRTFAAGHPDTVREIPSLGHKGYIAAVESSVGVIGNSSSGIVEVPSLGVPTLDIGRRQQGRQHGPSVIHVTDPTPQTLTQGLRDLLSPSLQATAARRLNPYYRPHTPAIIANGLLSS